MNEKVENRSFGMLKRRKIITRYVVFILLVFLIAVIFLVKTCTQGETEETVVYTENSKLDYKVYLKENEFFLEKYLEKDKQYIASLIEYISADFLYELDCSHKNIDFEYEYKVLAEIDVLDGDSKNSLYQYKEELVSEQKRSTNTSRTLKINENINIDYNKYNDLIKKFIDIYDLEKSKATLTINMYVNVLDDSKSAKLAETPVITLSIPLTTKTMAIDIESNAVNQNDISVYKTMYNSDNLFAMAVVMMVGFVAIFKLKAFMRDTESEQALYNMKLRKIMMSYSSYIQKIGNEYDFGKRQILEVKVFEDLLQIRETINQPVLMEEKEEAMETYFFVASEDAVYVYELKAGNLRKNRTRRYKTKEQHPENVEDDQV